MKKFFSSLYSRFRDIILYGIIGTFSSGLDFIIYSLLVKYIIPQYIIANCMSTMCGIVTSFILNRNYNFKVKDKIKQRFSIFLTVGICGLFLSNVILYLFIDVFGVDKFISKITSIILVVFFQFMINKYFTFSSPNDKTNINN
ncbi:MAG: GtrA family protein [Prevotella sp.]|nr:GtrA family protein [Prevotella sp.]MBR1526957.1 GtrA family protein [Prevotella sp.]